MTQLNLETPNNADWRQAITVSDEAGAVVDLTGADIQMDVKTRAGTTVLDLTVGSGIVITDAAAGEFEVQVSAAQMAALTPALYQFDVLLEVAGVRLRPAFGSVHVKKGITEWS